MNENKPTFSDIRLVVFDLDGTLVDTFQDIANAANHALHRMGRETYDFKTVMGFVGFGGRNLMRSLLGGEPADDEVARAFELWREYYIEHPADLARPYPGVEDTLKTLRNERNIRLAVLSNKSHDLVVAITRIMGLDLYFDAVLGEQKDAPRKPDPAVLLRIMERNQSAPDQTLFVGDSTADIQVARNARVPAVGVDYGVMNAGQLIELGAAVVVDAFPKILDLVDGPEK